MSEPSDKKPALPIPAGPVVTHRTTKRPGKPTGAEDSTYAAQLLGGGESPAVECRALRGSSREGHTDDERRLAASADQADARCVGPEADQLRVGARPWREALRADMECLEQIRLAGTVRPDDEREPRLQAELEPGIRAEVAKRDRRDDQPASRIGMIRYE